MNDRPRPLTAIREEIDRIDDQLLELVRRRAALAGDIAAAKREAGARPPFLRPGREAQVLRRVLGQPDKLVPRATLARVWREIMCANTLRQGPLAVALAGPAERLAALTELARDHFGAAVAVTVQRSAGAALSQVEQAPGTVAVLPWPGDEGQEAWWPQLLSPNAARAIVRLPFLARADGTIALVVAPIAPEASGADDSLVALTTDVDVSRGWLAQRLADAGLSGQLLDSVKQGALNRHLYVVSGFVAGDDVKLARLGQAQVIGAFAQPVDPSKLGSS
ncbi:MAG: chorismate mutase [Alphaproteobacteria bacterium]|nr:chorismate mutase [Alphaproteobacteria bacterium]